MQNKKSKSVKKLGYEPSEATMNFMLAEMQTLSDRWTHGDQIAEGRLNIFLTITTGSSGVLLLISQLNVVFRDFIIISSIIFLVVWLLGVITFFRMLDRSRVVIGFMRSMNRIRRFFVDYEPQISPYIAQSITDSEPKFTSFGGRQFGARTLVAVLSSVVFGLFCGAIYIILTWTSQVITMSVVLGASGFFIHLILAETYAYRTLRKYEQNYDVRFPK